MKAIIALLIALATTCCLAQDEFPDTPEIRWAFTAWKTKIKASPDLAHPALVITGDNKTIDFKYLRYDGSAPAIAPDQRKGLGIFVKGKNLTIKNLSARNYKVGLMAVDCPGLKIINCDFSDNWKQRLLSTPEAEDLSDWMSFHHNEKDEWLAFGAGIYLSHCDNFLVTNTEIQRGQCGLMVSSCNNGTITKIDSPS